MEIRQLIFGAGKVINGCMVKRSQIKKQRIAVCGGTFDPVTLGHLDVIGRASKLFDQVFVGVGARTGKDPLLELEERVSCLISACKSFPNVKVRSFKGLLVDFAKDVGATHLVRGVRSQGDFEDEFRMAQMNRHLESSLDTVFVPTSQELSHISSTLVRDIARSGGNIRSLTTTSVVRKLSEKLTVKS